MTPTLCLRVVALAATLAAVAVALALMPQSCQRLDVFVPLFLLGAAAGFVLYLPLGVAAGVENVDVLMLGPLAVLGCAAAVASGAALLAACSGHAAASWVLDAIAVGGFVAGWRVVGCR
jgi:hypothetical protein